MAKYTVTENGKERSISADEAFVKQYYPGNYVYVGEETPPKNPMKDLAKNDNWSQKERDDALRLILEKLSQWP